MGIEQLAEQMIGGRTEECWASLMEQVESGRNSLYIYEQWPGAGHAIRRFAVGAKFDNSRRRASGFMRLRYIDDPVCRTNEAGTAQWKRGMFLCVEEEAHYFGLKMVSALFEERGFTARICP